MQWKHMDLRYWLNPALFPAGRPGRTAAVEFVHQKYAGDIGAVNRAYDCNVSSFADLSNCLNPVGQSWQCQREGAAGRQLSTQGVADSDAFILIFAKRYFTVVTSAIRKFDTNHLLFGMRGGCFGSHHMLSLFSTYIDVVSGHGTYCP